LAGRIYGLDGAFCGVCRWQDSDINCYQRVNWLIANDGMDQLSSRQRLVNNGFCLAPEGGFDGLDPDLKSQVEGYPDCGNVPIVSADGEELPPPTIEPVAGDGQSTSQALSPSKRAANSRSKRAGNMFE